MMKKLYVKTLISTTTVLTVFAMLAAPLYAANTNSVRTERRCEVVQKKIGGRVSAYKRNRDNHKNAYLRIKDKVVSLVGQAKAQGLDTAILEADLKTLQEKIDAFAADADAFILKLEETNDYNCGQSEGVFLQKLNEAKELSKEARQSAKDTKSYIRETIREDIKNLREQKGVTPTPNP